MALSKKKRFEIFKRDQFTCQYCGQRPPAVILEADHIHPVSKGGTDEEINLITSCYDCNRGKSNRRLGDVHPRPDADVLFLETQQEIVEARRYLDGKKVLNDLREQIIEGLRRIWYKTIHDELCPCESQWLVWLNTYTPEEVEYAIIRTGTKLFKGSPHYIIEQATRYTSGVLKSVRAEG